MPENFFGEETGPPLSKGLDDCPPPLSQDLDLALKPPFPIDPLTCLKCMVMPVAALYFSRKVFGNNPEEVVGIRARFSLRSIFQ